MDTKSVMKLPIKQVERSRLTEKIVDRIVSLIASGELKRGDKLPPERVMMKQLGVGRSSLREAIESLSLMGVLTRHPGSGTHVSVSGEEFLAKPLSWGIPLGRGRLQELIEARRILEEAITALAAEKASEAEIAEIRHYLAEMKANHRNRRKVIKADLSFHIAMAKASHNTVLLGFITQIRNLLRSWIDKALLVPGVYDSTVEEHSEILSAIEAHDVEGARLALRSHLKSVGDALISIVLTRTSPE